MQDVMCLLEDVPAAYKPVIRGWDPNTGTDLDSVLGAMLTSGFQATALGQAIEEVNSMVSLVARRHQ
jgi:deoxyhypusine synthase